jgi:hypothetical protein
MVWLVAIFIVVPIFFLFISIPSFIQMYKIGIKDYIKQIKYLYLLSNKIDKCYVYSQDINQKFTYTDGSVKSINYKTSTYFLPIYINHNNVFIIDKKDNNLLYCERFIIKKFSRIDENWKVDDFEIKHTPCIWTMFIKDYFSKKVEKNKKSSIDIDNMDRIDEIINSHITSITREFKLKNIGIYE